MEKQRVEAEEEKGRLKDDKKVLEKQIRDLHDTVRSLELSTQATVLICA